MIKWKVAEDAVVAYFKPLSEQSSRGSEKNRGLFSQDDVSPG